MNIIMKKLSLLFILIIFLLSAFNKDIKSGEIEGISIFNKDKNYVTDYIPDNRVHIKEVVGDELTDKVAVITKSGEIVVSSSDIYIYGNKSVSAFTIDDENSKIDNIMGIYLYDDFHCITDSYNYMKNYLDNGERVLVVLLDGFSYRQFKEADNRDLVPFLSKNFKQEALSVYTPVTNAGFAAIITGQTPNINGVHDRSVRDMRVPTIFDYALKANKKALLLEGDIKILNTEIEPELHIDLNMDGDIDDEVYMTAMNKSQEEYELIFIHFHGIDDRGHEFGPLSYETMEYIRKVDTYLQEISKSWNGRMILTADHGMHEYEDLGSHGKCIYEDMVVPYFTKE